MSRLALRGAPLPGDWTEHAACRGTAPVDGVSPHPFFPTKGKKMAAVARALCDACPVQAHCRSYALRHPVIGIWGGLHEEQRVQWRRTHWRVS